MRKRTGGEYTVRFETFWSTYPQRNGKRVGKKATYRRWRKLAAADIPLLEAAAKHYAQSKIARVDGKARDPERFLKDDYWRDWLDGPGEDEHIEERDRHRAPTAQDLAPGPRYDPREDQDLAGGRSLSEAVRGLQSADAVEQDSGTGDKEPEERG